MPDNYESTLSGLELDDLVSFLITTASTPNPLESSRKRNHDED
jgi:hypothetical protein